MTKIKQCLAAAFLALPSGLFAIDSDSDGLDDAVETNTGIYVSPTNTGTNPNTPDSDGDGAGDWYEVATIDTHPANPQPNAPNSPAIKPGIPYPLPAPDASTGSTTKPVKVYILSGQSNMVGQGNTTPLGTTGTLATITQTENKFPHLRNGAVLDAAGYTIRNDVKYRGVIAATGKDKLKVGQGGSTSAIGPELGFGHVMGYYHDEPVLIIKSSQGGRALGWDFLPPGSVQYTAGGTIYAGYGDSPASWATGTTPVPTAGFYGGYQYDQCFLRKADWAPAGAANAAVFNVTDVLDNFATEYPDYAAQGFEIAGFAWFHGWNDGLSYTAAYANRYEVNMAQFIRQIRAYYESRYPGKIQPKAPFVIATAAFEGWSEAYLNQYPTRRAVLNAQLAVSDPVKYPEFAGNVKTMEARGFWRDVSVSPANQGYHYHRNAETFMLVGDALGRGMIDLLASAAPDTTPPAISAFHPADDATGVAAGANLVLTFNEAIVPGTGNITIKNLTDGTQATIAVADSTQVSINGSFLTINPAADLAAGKSYAIRIDAGAIKDASDNPFAGIADDTTWNFTTQAPDTTAPVISTLSPADNATGVAISASLAITFNEPIVLGTGDIAIRNLSNSTQTTIPVTDATQVSLSGAVLTIKPTASLAGDSNHAIRIDAGAVRDLANNPFAGIADDTTWNFTTAAAPTPGNITFDKFVSGYIGGTPKSFTFDASGSDKLVVIVTGEHNFSGNTSGNVKSITYDGVSLTKALEQNPVSSTLQTTSDLWYLDTPGVVHLAGQVVISVEGSGNNYVHAALALSGTAPGFGGASAVAIGAPAVNLNVSSPNSLVIAWLTLGGNGNTAGTATSIQSSSPATAIKFCGAVTGGNYAGHVLSRSSGLTPGMQTFSFNTGLTDVLCLAAEFLADQAPTDTTPPTLVSIADDKGGGPVAVNTLVTYTVTFSEDMDAGTVSADDFGNAGSAAVTIGTVSETSPGVFTVPVTPTGAGTIQLQVIAGTDLKDVAANALDTAAAIADDTTLTVTEVQGTVSIAAVYFGQTHLHKPDHPYFGLVGGRDCLIKAHVTDPDMTTAPAVTAVLKLNGQTLDLPLSGPATLPAAIPDGLGVVQHSLSDSFTATIPAAWVKTGLQVTVNAGAASVSFTDLKVGAPTKVVMTMFDVSYFTPTSGDYPAGWQAELEAKWPVADLELRRVPNIVFRELVVPPRPDVGAQAVRVKSQGDYTLQTGLGFDGEQAAALAWNGALKRASGRSGRTSLYYTSIYGVNAGGQAGGFAGVGNGTAVGILHHELGHALSLPHWGDSATYPYKGDMYGILAPDSYNGTHAGPVWGYDPRLNAFIPPTVQPGNVGNKPLGTYKVDPMQGGGTGWQEPGFLMNHFSDYSVFKMREYLHGHVLVWNASLDSYASWNQAAGAYTNTVSNNGVQYPRERDAQVISVMASISGAKPAVNMVYPPIGPYTSGLIRLFDPRVSADRSAAVSTGYAPSGGCDVSLRVIQGGVEKTYMLAAPWEPGADLLSGGSLKTEAINLPAADGSVTLAELLYTPDAQVNGLPADPQVLATWAPVMPDPAGFAVPPVAGNSSVISMTATTGTSELGPVEYLFTETSGHPGGSSSGWQSSPVFTDTGLQPSTTYSYTVALRAGGVTGRASSPASATTAAAGLPGTITFDGFVSDSSGGAPKTFSFDASQSDKLVVVVTGEHNNPGSTAGDVVSVTYDGVSLTKAVEQPAVSSAFQTTSDLWYLDNPGSVHTAGQIVVTLVGNGNNFVHTAIGLSGTAPGFAGASAIAVGSPSVNMNVSATNSLVLSWLTLGGSGNTAGTATTIQASAPAGTTTFSGVKTSGNYAGHVLARTSGLPVGSNTFSFGTSLTDVITLSAEFLAADLPAPPYSVWTAGPFAGTLDDPSPARDFDQGGLPTGIEWVVGGDPATGSDDPGLAPTFNMTTDPHGKLQFNFRRRDAAHLDPDTSIAVEYGSDLAGWTSATHQGTGADDITISSSPDGPGFSRVTVALPRHLTASGRLFARLKVTVATP